MNSFQTYLIGFIILIIGVAAGAYLLGAPPVWIAIGIIVLVGIGIMGATNRNNPGDGSGPTY